MNDTIFVYRKDDKFKVLDIEAARNNDNELRNDGWLLVSTLKASMWLQYFINADADKQESMLKEFNAN